MIAAPRTQDRLSPLAVLDAARAAAKARTPFSAIRLGDGEGRVLGHPGWTSAAELEDIWRTWFGPEADPRADIGWVAAGLREACLSADIIGLPPSPPNERTDFGRPEAAVVRGRLAGSGTRFADSSFHLAVHNVLGEDFYGRLLADAECVGVVGCRDVGDALLRRYGVTRTAWVRTPPEMAHADAGFPETDTAGKHLNLRYPEMWEQALPALLRRGDVRLVLVGAGVLGKLYCRRIKALGGAALDVGSMMDLWAGLRTRGAAQFDGLRAPGS